MKDTTTGTDTREPRPLHASVMGYDLRTEAERLRAEPEWAEYGRTSKTLAKEGELRVVLTALRSGAAIGDDDAHGPIAVHVLEGEVETDRAGTRLAASAGTLTWFAAGAAWSVRATSDATVLLSLTHPFEPPAV